MLLGVAARLAAYHLNGSYEPHYADPYNYTQLARAMASGRGLVIDDAIYGPGLRAFYPPVYPTLLAVFFTVLGSSTLTILVMNTLTDLLTAALVRRLDLKAAAIFFCWPTMIVSSIVAQKESLVCLLAMVLASIAMRCRRQISATAALAFGAFSALLVLTQPACAVFPIALAVVFMRKAKGSVRYGALAMIAGVAFMLPWWIRNWLVLGRFVPLTTSAPVSLSVVTDGHAPLSAEALALPEVVRFSAIHAAAVDQVKHHPGLYLWQVLSQTMSALFTDQFAVRRSFAPPQWSGTAFTAAHDALLALAAFGRNRQAALLLLCGVASLVPIIWLEFGERHRYFLLPALALLAVSGRRPSGKGIINAA